MDADTIMTDCPRQPFREDDDTSSVVVWVEKPNPGSDQEMEEDDESPPPTIIVASRHNEEALSLDGHSQRMAEKLYDLQMRPNQEGLTIPELTKRAQEVISALERQGLGGKYQWRVENECVEGGLPRRYLRSIASEEYIDDLVAIPRDPEIGDTKMGDDDDGLTQGMRGIRLDGH